MSNAAAAEQAKLKKRLEALLKLPENQLCVDCSRRGARWASANLGVFMCIECSGIHVSFILFYFVVSIFKIFFSIC